MNTFISSFATGTVQAWEAATLVVAAVAIRVIPRDTHKSRHANVDRHTLQDIGVEPGSITWIR